MIRFVEREREREREGERERVRESEWEWEWDQRTLGWISMVDKANWHLKNDCILRSN
jgi:hypothetical protein